jgi:hypothetical protein
VRGAGLALSTATSVGVYWPVVLAGTIALVDILRFTMIKIAFTSNAAFTLYRFYLLRRIFFGHPYPDLADNERYEYFATKHNLRSHHNWYERMLRYHPIYVLGSPDV